MLDSYDDATYSTQTKRYAFHSTYDDYSIWSSLIGGYTPGPFSVEGLLIYKKDIHREQPDYNKSWKQYGQESYSSGLRAELKNNALLFSSEARYDYLAAFSYPNSKALNYRIGLKYNIHAGHLGLIFGSTTRFPTMKEKYSYRLGRSLPNPDLRPERQTSIMLEGKINPVDNISLNFYTFYSDLSDLIESVEVGNNIEQNQNIKKAFLEGFFAESLFKKDSFSVSASFQGLWSRDLEHHTILPYRPRWRVNASTVYNIKKINLSAGLVGQFITYYQDSYTLEMKKLGSWYTIWARIGYHVLKNVEIYARGTNLLDRNYETEKNFPAPGRELYVGLTGEF